MAIDTRVPLALVVTRIDREALTVVIRKTGWGPAGVEGVAQGTLGTEALGGVIRIGGVVEIVDMARGTFATDLCIVRARMTRVTVGDIVYSGQVEHGVKSGDVPADGVGIVGIGTRHGVARCVVVGFCSGQEVVRMARVAFRGNIVVRHAGVTLDTSRAIVISSKRESRVKTWNTPANGIDVVTLGAFH